MKLLYCHDGPLFKDENGTYYSLGLSNEIFQRYDKISDKIQLAIRTRKVNSKDITGKMTPITLPNLEVIECPNLSTIKGTIFERRSTKKKLERLAANADFIICRLPSHIGHIGVDVAKKIGKPYIIELVACPWDSLWNYNLKGKIVAPFFAAQTKIRVKDAPYVVYVTNEFLQNRYPTKGKNTNCSNVIINKVDDKVLEKRLEKIEKNNGKIIIGTTASLDIKFKGQEHIIEALGILKKKGNTSFKYQLVGKGSEQFLKEVAQKNDVQDQVEFLGSKTRNDVMDWLDNIDFYGQPSKQEGLPRALIEAMSRGLPSMGANTGGIPELINNKFILNKRKNFSENIAKLLESLDKSEMRQEAIANFEESKNYIKSDIEKRRQKFLIDFAKSNKII